MRRGVRLAGRVVSNREASKSLYFVDIQSGHGTQVQKVQIISERQHFAPGDATLPGAQVEFREMNRQLQVGDVIGVVGFPGTTNRGQLSLVAQQIVVLAPCLKPLPAPGTKVPTDLDKRFRNRAMDLLVNEEARKVIQTRSRTVSMLRAYLEDQGFMEVETPILSASAGGATALPFVTRARPLVLILTCIFELLRSLT